MPDAVAVQNPESFNNTEQAPDLNAIVGKWRWLVPSDVDVRIKYADLDGVYAECRPQVRLGRLLIKINQAEWGNPVDQEFGFKRDVEADVVHELLHWRFELFQPEENTAAYEAWEAAVERTAQDLIRMNRKGI